MSKTWEIVEYPSRPTMVAGLLSFRETGHQVETIDGLRTIAVLMDEGVVDELLDPATPLVVDVVPDLADVPPAEDPVVPDLAKEQPAYSVEPDPAEVRAWAKDNDIEVKGGFLPKAIVEQYKAAHAGGEGLL